ncbi:hypothetical protein LEMLEM_LOCUS7483 [Lemmus lemmus]
MASGRRGWDSSHEDDLPVYLARPGTTDQVPRQKYGGMFCNVEGAFESKTLDFDALSVGQRGAKTPRSSQGSGRGAGSRPGVEGDTRRGQGREESRDPAPESPKSAGVEIRSATGKEVLQNLGPKDKVESTLHDLHDHQVVKNCDRNLMKDVLDFNDVIRGNKGKESHEVNRKRESRKGEKREEEEKENETEEEEE